MTQVELDLEWNRGTELRGCTVCTQGHAGLCTSPEVTGGRQPVLFEKARAPGGVCGPEALCMVLPE